MFTWSHEVTTTARPHDVWPFYADVDLRTAWDPGLVDLVLDGPFLTGTTGVMTVEGQPPLAFHLAEVLPGESFTDVTEIPGVATLTFSHRLVPCAEGTRIVHDVRVEGPSADELGPMVVSDTPEAMQALASLAAIG